MSMVTQLISAVSDAERRIDDQIMKLQSYLSQIDRVAQRTDAAFSGSAVQYGKDMVEQLSLTKKQVNDTIGYLQQAKEKLIRVRMI